MDNLKVFVASLGTETNTFSPLPTDLGAFEETFYAPPGEHPSTPTLCSAPITVLRARAAADATITLVEGSAAWAEPAGIISRYAFEKLRDEILAQLRDALPVDAVVLGLHGAMVAQGYDDCEGDILARVRSLVGEQCVVAAELDPHSHLTDLRFASADILVAFKEFAHVDFVERAEELVDLALRAARGEIKPSMQRFDCKMIEVLPTSTQPMRGFVDKMMRLEAHSRLSTMSLIDAAVRRIRRARARSLCFACALALALALALSRAHARAPRTSSSVPSTLLLARPRRATAVEATPRCSRSRASTVSCPPTCLPWAPPSSL